MTDLAAAMADNSALHDFEGTRVLRTQVAITNAGDGLSKAMGIEPLALDMGADVYVVLECRVQKISYVPTNKDDPTEGLARLHTLRAGRASLVDRASVEGALADQAERIRVAEEQAKGITRLPLGADSDEYDEDEDEDDDDEPDPGPAADMRAARTRRRRQ